MSENSPTRKVQIKTSMEKDSRLRGGGGNSQGFNQRGFRWANGQERRGEKWRGVFGVSLGGGHTIEEERGVPVGAPSESRCMARVCEAHRAWVVAMAR